MTKKIYKLTKDLSIQYTKQLLKNDVEHQNILNFYEKKDDMCDAYLQGRYYLEFIKNKKNIINKKSTDKSWESKSKSNPPLKGQSKIIINKNVPIKRK